MGNKKSECKRLRLLDQRQLADLVQNLFADGAVDFDQRDRIQAWPAPAEVEVRDVNLCFTKKRSEPANEAWLILVGDIEHVRRKLGIEIDVLDLDEAWSAVGKDSARDASLETLGRHGDLHVTFVDTLLVATRLAHPYAAFLGDDGSIDHIDVHQRRLKQTCQCGLRQCARV